MSQVCKCDGCYLTSLGSQTPKEWLKADVRNGHGTSFAVGDFCSENCLAKFLCVDPLDRQWKKNAGKEPTQ